VKQLVHPPPAPNGAAQTVPTARTPASKKRMYWIAGTLVLLLVLVFAYALRPKPAAHIVTAPIVRKPLVAVVTATGTVNPQDTISVGTQVSGTILTIVADYNAPVRQGQVLARLDPTLFQAALDQSRATLAQAQEQWQSAIANATGAKSTTVAAYANADAAAENVRVAQAAETSADANVDKTRSALTLARQTLTRDRTLLPSGYIAQSQYDTDYSNEVAAQAALSGAIVTANQARMQLRAARNQATAGTAQGSAAGSQASGFAKTAAADLAAIDAAQAAVRQATINLNHTVITSPVNGTVIARNVSEGQTVAASFTTPTLYTIAKDLTKMEIDLAVGEPDIGSVQLGQRVNFTVLAYPNRTFQGIVAQVRENPTTIQNVVTYDTVVYEHNADNALRPGMTASAEIQVAHVDNAIVVPLAALTFHATGTQPQARRSPRPQTTPAGSPWGNTGTAQTATLGPGSLAQVTLVGPGGLKSIPVRILLVSGGEAAIQTLGAPLPAGSAVAVSAGTTQTETPSSSALFR
jgi:HlyD family secretion protein